MTAPRYDVLGIGNAIVDVIARAEDDFLLAQGMRKGGMALIDEPRAASIYDAMGPAIEVSGGSAANSIVGVASFGARAAFVGRVKADPLGAVFGHDIRAAAVAFDTPAAADGPSTGRCYIMVTPDGERTMNTFLGAAQDLHPDDIDPQAIAGAAITYLEGYLWDPPHAKAAFLKAAEIAHSAERRVALTLSDAFCVDRWRDEFLELMRKGTVDVVFANESELHALYQTAAFDDAVNQMRNDVAVGVVTRGERGCLVVTYDRTFSVAAAPIETLVDTTGAGDLFAAGFLFGLARERTLDEAARLGAVAAAEVIQHIGARPQRSLAALAEQSGLTL